MSTVRDIALEYFPGADDRLLEFVIWEKTGYPCFWNIPEDGNTPEECFRKQLKAAAEELHSKLDNYVKGETNAH